jgi:ABC-type transporter Mla subunit MlaD
LSEPHIEISPQPGKAPFLKDSDRVLGADPVPVETLVDRASLIASHLEAILGRFKGAVEDADTGAAIRETTKNLATLTRSLNQILSGSEEELGDTLRRINNSTQSLEVVLSRMEKGEGTIGKLMKEEEIYHELRDFVKEIKTHPWRLLKRDEDKKK